MNEDQTACSNGAYRGTEGKASKNLSPTAASGIALGINVRTLLAPAISRQPNSQRLSHHSGRAWTTTARSTQYRASTSCAGLLRSESAVRGSVPLLSCASVAPVYVA